MGLQVEPTIRLAWSPVAGHSVWAAASRAVRSPSRAEHDHRVNAAVAPGPTVISIFGDSDIREEELLAVEVGYRGQPHAALTLDVAGFYNWYDDLVAGEFAGFYFESDPAPTHGVVATTTENALKALTYGVEGTATWDVVDGFRLRATYALLRVKASEKRGHPPSTDDAGLEGEPRHRGTLWASLDLPFRIEADIAARWTGHTYRPELGSWTELDARLGWRTPWGGEVGVAGRNLLHASHRESASAASGGISLTEPERAVWGYLSWRF
jgi:iron complex outermembrane receptor protein